MLCSYVNKKGKGVDVVVTNHALNRFRQRYSRLNPKCNTGVMELLPKLIRKARPMDISNTKKYKKRNKRRGNSTVYLKTDGLTFIVQNQTLITVEISAKHLRHMN